MFEPHCDQDDTRLVKRTLYNAKMMGVNSFGPTWTLLYVYVIVYTFDAFTGFYLIGFVNLQENHKWKTESYGALIPLVAIRSIQK